MICGDSNRRTGLVVLLLTFGTLALYWPARHYDFVRYDDPEYVFENSTVRAGLSWWGFVWSFVDAHAANWHPLTWLSHMLDCQLFGLHAGPHHLVSVLIHAANAALLFLVLRSLTGSFWRSALVAAVFAWHPLRVESVAWISERKDVLSGLFFMLTIWAYARVQSPKSKVQSLDSRVRTPQSPAATLRAPRSRHLTLPLVFFALGLLCKPMLVTLPAVLLLLDFWPLRRFQAADLEERHRAWRAALLEKVPFALLSLGAALITFFSQRSGGAVIPLASEGLASRLANAVAGYLGYLEKIFWPQDLSMLYLRPQHLPISTILFAMMVFLTISGLALKRWRQQPYLAVGWLWFVGMLLPVCGLVQIGLQSIADRYTYLPGIGLALMLSWGIPDLASGMLRARGRQWVLGSAAVAVLIACAALSRSQLGVWRNTETLMQQALRVDPANYVAHQNLGVYYSRLGREEEARQHRERVRELDPALAAKAR